MASGSGITFTGWADGPFNEKKPFGKVDAVVAGDNIEFSQQRWDAIKAVRTGRATPEQRALVMETDRVMQEALGLREE